VVQGIYFIQHTNQKTPNLKIQWWGMFWNFKNWRIM